MFKNKSFFAFLAIFLLVGAAWGQERLTDDRELFIGVTGNTEIAPNVMILMDNSGSMEAAIYHPAYNANIDYSHDASGHQLTINNLSNFFNTSRFGNAYRTLPSSKTFNICRGTPHFNYAYDARGTYGGRVKNNPRIWKVFRGEGTFAVGDIIDYNGDGSGINDKTRVISVSSLKYDSRAHAYYWELTVDTNYPGFDGNPDSGSYLYVNYRMEADYTDSTIAELTAPGDSCTGYETSFLNVKLYGETAVQMNEGVLYDMNYLYWLCFQATAQQVAEVTNWATTGNYLNPETGVVEYAGYYRIAVAKDVLTTVAAEVYQQVRLGLARFKYDDDSRYGRRHDHGRDAEQRQPQRIPDQDQPHPHPVPGHAAGRDPGRHLVLFQGRPGQFLLAQRRERRQHQLRRTLRHRGARRGRRLSGLLPHPVLVPEKLRHRHDRRPVDQ